MTGTGTCVLDGQQLNSNITLIGYTTALCFLLQPFYLRCFVVHFWLKKSGCCCVRASKAKQIVSINHMDRKVVGGKFNVLVHYVDDCLPNLSGVVFCNPSIWDILLFISGQKSAFSPFKNSKMNSETYPYYLSGKCQLNWNTNQPFLY